jgi:hypothetical protein
MPNQTTHRQVGGAARRAGQLRAYVESLGKGYVFTVPTSFTVTCADGVHTVRTLLERVAAGGWSQRSCEAGCKGHRWYEWAWIATSSPSHQVLVRRSPDHPSKVTFFYCHAPHGATLACLVRIAGRRWPAETCSQAAKSIQGIDAHKVRLWHSWQRHTALTLLAAAILAVATAAPAQGEATAEAADADTDDADTDDADTDDAGGSVQTSDHATTPTLPTQPARWARHRHPASATRPATTRRPRHDQSDHRRGAAAASPVIRT